MYDRISGEMCQALSTRDKGTDQMLSMHGSFHEQQEGPAVARGTKT